MDIAQQNYDYQSSTKGPEVKIANNYELIKYVEYKIMTKKYSLDAVIMDLEKNNFRYSDTSKKNSEQRYVPKPCIII